MQYLIKKEYGQSTQRDLRTALRAQIKNTTTEKIVSKNPLPFVQLIASKTPIDDSSSDENTTEPIVQDNISPSNTDNGKSTEASSQRVDILPNTTTDNITGTPYYSDHTKHAEELEKDMDSAMADIKDPEPPQEPEDITDTLEALIAQTVNSKLELFFQLLDEIERQLQDTTNKYKSLLQAHNELSLKYDELRIKHSRINRQINFNSRAIGVIEELITPLETSKIELAQMKLTVQNLVDKKTKFEDTETN